MPVEGFRIGDKITCKFFFSKHKDGKYSHKAIQLGYPSDTKAEKQPAKVKAQQKRLDIQNSSEDDDVHDKNERVNQG